MTMEQKFCQSCGMPLTDEILGTNADVDKEYVRAVSMGAAPIFPPTTMPWGQRTSYIADPEGNLIEISSFCDE